MKAFSTPTKTAKNLLGFLLSLGAAFGGLFLVQNRLALETERLLAGGGQTMIPRQIQGTAMTAEITETTIYTQEDHLLRFTEDLKNRAEAVPHDPLSGQLSMAGAVESAKTWLEDFFMPGLSATDFRLSEYKTDCYLWTVGKEEEERNPLYSYWNIALRGRELEASLTLNALTGQVLEASVVCNLPSAYSADECLPALLSGYADALCPDETYSLLFVGDLLLEIEETPSVEEGSGPSDQNGSGLSDQDVSFFKDGTFLYQSVGSHGVLAAVSAENIVLGSPEKDHYTDVVSIRLYLTLESEVLQGKH